MNRTHLNSASVLAAFVLSWLMPGGAGRCVAAASPTVDFARDVQPIFAASCVECHGPEKQKGGLRLDGRDAAMKGGTSGPLIVAGKGVDSLLVHRLKGLGDEPRMPPEKKQLALSAAQIDVVQRWIDQGATWPDAVAGATGAAASTTHWSFVKPTRPPEPAVRDAKWAKNPIDRFVLAKLEAAKLTPSPEADRPTQFRRVALDLTGLPPTPDEVDAFVADKSPDAYEKAVDRLLASPHFGERWGKHWLDGARYADSNGYSIDAPREMWRWRDWVIDAVNRDLPFDQFTVEQLAGDLLPDAATPEATAEQKVATGFHRNTMVNQEGGIDPEQFRVESVIDRVGTTGTVWLGLTVACAQCHNHKFDPIGQKEYYRLYAFLNNQDEPTLKFPTEADKTKAEELKRQILDLERELLPLAASQTNPPPKSKDTKGNAAGGASAAIRRRIAALKKQEAALGVSALVLTERKTPRDNFLFIKGDFTRRGEDVTPGVPAVLPPIKPATTANTLDPAKLTRLDLARWLVAPENPLTARVQVNRFWMHYFGRGIVETENDFGTQGTPPSHPQLLDWLATEFVRQGWSAKAVHRLIVTSAAYRQASTVRADLTAADPYNLLLGRQNRFRLDAEVVRDVGLSASGLLAGKVGGPSVFPPQPDGVMGLGQVKREWTPSMGPDRYRRGMYTFLYRATPHPLLGGFDAPDGTSTCTRRLRSNTPLQALTLLNDSAFVEMAQSLAKRVMRGGDGSDSKAPERPDDARLVTAFRLATGRTPDGEERKILAGLLAEQRAAFVADPAAAGELAPARLCPPGVAPAELAAWTIVGRAVLNLDEAITRE